MTSAEKYENNTSWIYVTDLQEKVRYFAKTGKLKGGKLLPTLMFLQNL